MAWIQWIDTQVVQATWRRNALLPVDDPTMYTGVLGSAMLCFKAYLATHSAHDLVLAAEIVDSCCASAPNSPEYVPSLVCSIPSYFTPLHALNSIIFSNRFIIPIPTFQSCKSI